MLLARVVIIAVSVILAMEAMHPKAGAQTPPQSISQQNSDFVDTLTRLLIAEGLHAVLIQHRICQGNDEQVPLMHNVTTHINTSAQSVSAFFAADPSWHVESRGNGLVLIRRGEVGNLIRTPLNELRLEPREQFDPELALERAMKQPEFKMEAEKLHAHSVTRFGSFVSPIQDGAKHLPNVLPRLTMEDFLIQETRTFGGLAIYNECLIGSHETRFDMQVFPGDWSH